MDRSVLITNKPEPPIQTATQTLDKLILGKQQQIRLALTCLLAGGHLLIEDVPGVGKTTLAHALAGVFGLDFSRVQFTADLLPSDILGVSIYETQQFNFHHGPIFAQLVLADEINRASPKAQSALLEAMEEGQVTVENATRTLPDPFFVIATQNPLDQAGTFPLPESQLDRFLMTMGLGYPPETAERALLQSPNRRTLLEELTAVSSPSELRDLQTQVTQVHTSDALLDYILALVQQSRYDGLFRQGLSPRAGLGLRRAAQAWAFLTGRDHVLPEDVQTVLASVVDHRLAIADSDKQMQSPGALLKAHVPLP